MKRTCEKTCRIFIFLGMVLTGRLLDNSRAFSGFLITTKAVLKELFGVSSDLRNRQSSDPFQNIYYLTSNAECIPEVWIMTCNLFLHTIYKDFVNSSPVKMYIITHLSPVAGGAALF